MKLHTIKISINPATKTGYANKGCYLHKNDTWHAIRAKWNDEKPFINSLYITIDEQQTEILNYSLDDLGLFDSFKLKTYSYFNKDTNKTENYAFYLINVELNNTSSSLNIIIEPSKTKLVSDIKK